MRYECDMIADLLPLYIDGACSGSSKQVVEEHLAECPQCAKMLEKMKDSLIDDEIIKVSFFDPGAQADKTIYPQLKKFNGRLQVVLASAYWVDVIGFGINKGMAIQQVQKKLKITPKECAAFGDYMNDAEMMSSVYYSYAMANAHPKVKELARFEAKSNAEHGVMVQIRELLQSGMCGEKK